VVELVRDEVPALVLLADEVAHRHAQVLVVRDVRVEATHVLDGLGLEAGESVGTMMIEMPLCFFTFGSVRTASQM
jgi:hypothetical protein